jgi:hypothetical protein
MHPPAPAAGPCISTVAVVVLDRVGAAGGDPSPFPVKPFCGPPPHLVLRDHSCGAEPPPPCVTPAPQSKLVRLEAQLKKRASGGSWQSRFFSVRFRALCCPDSAPVFAPTEQRCRHARPARVPVFPRECVRGVVWRVLRTCCCCAQTNNGYLLYFANSKKSKILGCIDLRKVVHSWPV